jgi:hypothetical protein
MKLTQIKGIAHDLAYHLDFQILFGDFKNLPIPKESTRDLLKPKSAFDKHCLEFFKKRLPKSFDFKRITELLITIHRSMTSISINIKVKVDDKEFSYSNKSTMS